MSTQMKYAYRRHNTWIYRRTYPVHLHDVLGSSLKRSLHTPDAKVAAKRVAELNTTFEAIVAEAEAKLADGVQSGQPPQLAIAVPRYQRARLLGEQPVQEVAAIYLAEVSARLRPGSYKSVRFALELLTSHVGERKLGDLNDTLGKEVLGVYRKAVSQHPQVQPGTGGPAGRASHLVGRARRNIPDGPNPAADLATAPAVP